MGQRFGNCWTHAITKWARHGGYIVIRRSKFMPVPHVMWAESLEGQRLEEFKPDSSRFRGIGGFIRSLGHFGTVVTFSEAQPFEHRNGFHPESALVIYFILSGVALPVLLLIAALI